ncbi:MAG: transposase family protein [Prevotella sp.]|jgi:hypothetical protein|nr:transposase family protein [Prevotella sp.]
MNLLDFANSIPDFRQELKIQHQASDIIFITVAAVICGAQDWEDIEYFGHARRISFVNTCFYPMGFLPMILSIVFFQP